MYIKKILIAVATFLLVATNNSFAAETQTNVGQTEQKKDVPAAPAPTVVFREIKKGMPLLGEGVGITTMKPAPDKSQVMNCRQYNAGIIISLHPTVVEPPCP